MDQQTTEVTLIDAFIVPGDAKAAFLEKTALAQRVIKTMPGFVEGYVYTKIAGNGTYNVVTTAVWENETAMAKARELIAAEYAKANFNPSAIMQELGVQIERATYVRKPY